jgi:hypothetical protein
MCTSRLSSQCGVPRVSSARQYPPATRKCAAGGSGKKSLAGVWGATLDETLAIVGDGGGAGSPLAGAGTATAGLASLAGDRRSECFASGSWAARRFNAASVETDIDQRGGQTDVALAVTLTSPLNARGGGSSNVSRIAAAGIAAESLGALGAARSSSRMAGLLHPRTSGFNGPTTNDCGTRK